MWLARLLGGSLGRVCGPGVCGACAKPAGVQRLFLDRWLGVGGVVDGVDLVDVVDGAVERERSEMF